MNKKIPANILDSLIEKAIINEAEQDNIDFGHALKNITPEQLGSIFGKKRDISSSMIDVLTDCAIKKEAEQGNAEIGHALKGISKDGLESIVGRPKPKVVPFKKLFRERIMWAASVAAIFIGALPVGNHIATIAKNEGVNIGKCETLYACNLPEIPSSLVRNRGGELPNIAEISVSQLKDELPQLVKLFNESEELQETDIYGRILSMAYLKLHKGDEAKKVLLIMKERLSADPEDYEETLEWCDNLISQLQ